jgi:2-hydroxy-3-keto-5-methylthiopentenyl-1-phosphate phosphatase
LIGDGRSDCCLAEKAALTLAKAGEALERHCQERQVSYLAYTDFFSILELFADGSITAAAQNGRRSPA